MPTPLLISLVGLFACSVVLAVYWGVVLMHVLRTRLRIPTARAGLGPASRRDEQGGAWASVCVVVPAHNEAACIQSVAMSLIKQDYPDLRVVFALDRCTDDTEQRLRASVGDDARVEIVSIGHCPADWAGKVHAIWRGVSDSTGAREAEYLLFIDADTTMDRMCVKSCVALAEEHGWDMLSLLSTMTCEDWFERVVQPAAGMELIRQFPIERANIRSGSRRRAFANGQFIMMRSTAYRSIGGHERVREALLEDIALAREVARADLPAGMLIAQGMHMCRMYASWEEFTRGWRRIYIDAGNRRPSRLRTFATRVRLLGVWLPLAALGSVLVGALATRAFPGFWTSATLLSGGAGLVLMHLALALIYRWSSTPVAYLFAYPVGAWHVGSILRQAANEVERGGKTIWGGREYVLSPR